MKRALTAAAIGLLVFSGVYGFAASLSVTSDSLWLMNTIPRPSDAN